MREAVGTAIDADCFAALERVLAAEAALDGVPTARGATST
jgi:hypothetical protein